jgi:predicted aspartyl protease
LAAGAVPIQLVGNAMYINATIQGVTVRMKIDTGANRTLMGTADFARVMAAGAAVAEARQERAVDVNGITRNARVRVLSGRMQAGNLVREGFAVYEGVGNLLGMDFFLGHEIVFDAARGQAWFEPYKGKGSQGRN